MTDQPFPRSDYAGYRKPNGLLRFRKMKAPDRFRFVLQQQWTGMYGENPEWIDVPIEEEPVAET